MWKSVRRIFCCGSDPPTNEPIYENLRGLHQAHDSDAAVRLVVESVDEIRRLLLPIADVQDRMRRLKLNLHPLLVYRPEDGEYMEMQNVFGPAPAVYEQLAPNVWQEWLVDGIDYGEPW